jgi:hypothetical protein
MASNEKNPELSLYKIKIVKSRFLLIPTDKGKGILLVKAHRHKQLKLKQ